MVNVKKMSNLNQDLRRAEKNDQKIIPKITKVITEVRKTKDLNITILTPVQLLRSLKQL